MNLTNKALEDYFRNNQNILKEICGIIKLNAKARREGDKVKKAVVKSSLGNWGGYKLKSYDPCSNRGKEYKELFIIEGDKERVS